MALDIVTQDITIDETAGLQDDDVNTSVPPHDTNTTLSYLVALDSLGGLTSPEVAFQSDFVKATASAGETITSVVLAQNLAGTPFSTTVGVNSGIRTVDGNYVWLFQDPTYANVVIGVIGTSAANAEPAETGPLAFSFALISTSPANADLYTVQYVPLLNPDTTNPDDRIDLTNKVFASVSGTTVVNFSQLGDAPPGHNNWYILDADVAGPQKILVTAKDNGVQAEVNVSTQGLGVASQDVRLGRELQIDLITGGTQSAGKNFTDTPTAPDYTAHIETVSSAGFSVSQSTPTNTKADIEIHAYNNDDNVEGAAFPGDDNDTEINITGVTFKLNGVVKTAAELGITVDLTGTGLILRNVGEGVTVDFTTAGGVNGTFDRFTIKNIDADHDFFDVKEVHFAGETTNAHSEEVGSFINFDDDGPTITAPFDADPVTPDTQTPEKLGNAVGQTANGTFGYDIGADSHPASFYNTTTQSDFVDANLDLGGIQIGLTGAVDNSQNADITQAVATLTAETDTSATFNFSFHYDKDPITAGVQDATAAGTLTFNKAADTYTLSITDAIDGFSFDILHTNELVAKQPTGNTGHPEIVVEQLTQNNDPNPFFVQFTANSTTQKIAFGLNDTGEGDPTTPGDSSWEPGQFVTNNHEDWVSATQSTNGVAGDTIQKGELLTLRFFEENILGDVASGTENTQPTTTANGLVIKFDGIGNSEDLVLILNLVDANGNETTRSINVQNSDLIKENANIPFPYNTEFTLDNNDALVIIESNDYNAGSETYQIQGVQIMQSANGLTGNAIDLNGATGANGGSSATSNLTAWDPTDNDVLKIVDIGFVQETTGTIDANLDFSFKLADADGDQTDLQHILVNISNDFIV